MKRAFAPALRRRASRRLSLSNRAGSACRALALLLAVALLNLSAAAAPATHGARAHAGEITIIGGATVDGTPAASGQTFFPGSTVATAADSRSTVNLGELGRLELAPETSLLLDFDGDGSACSLGAGRVRVFAPKGVGAAVKTADAAVTSAGGETAVFGVESKGGVTNVVVQSGQVEVRAGESLRRLSAGETYSSAPAQQGSQQQYMSGRKRAGLYLALAAAVAVVLIVIASRDDDKVVNECPPLAISPVGNVPCS